MEWRSTNREAKVIVCSLTFISRDTLQRRRSLSDIIMCHIRSNYHHITPAEGFHDTTLKALLAMMGMDSLLLVITTSNYSHCHMTNLNSSCELAKACYQIRHSGVSLASWKPTIFCYCCSQIDVWNSMISHSSDF